MKRENQLPKVIQGVTFRDGVEINETPIERRLITQAMDGLLRTRKQLVREQALHSQRVQKVP